MTTTPNVPKVESAQSIEEIEEKVFPQLGERTVTHIGGNISPERQAGFRIAARLETAARNERIEKNLREQIAGRMRSPLDVTFREIAADSSVLDSMQPLSEDEGMDGKILLWQGYEGTKRPEQPKWHLSTPEYRILRTADKRLIFQRKRAQQWQTIPKFVPPPFFHRKPEDEMGSNVRASVTQDTQRNTVVTRNRNYVGV